MTLRISASSVKYWFQYRCDRRLAYDSLPGPIRKAIPIEQVSEKSSWAAYGTSFEDDVVARLKAKTPGSVVSPAPGEDALTDAETLCFLRGELAASVAHQLLLRETPVARERLGLPSDVLLNEGRPDLVFSQVVGGRRVFRIVDVKATQVATLFHRTQVAFYALVLRAILEHQGIDADIDARGAIWRIPDGGQKTKGDWFEEPFALAGYEEAVRDFFRRDFPRVAQYEVAPTKDNTFFHLYFKCEQCPYVPRCEKSVLLGPAEQRDLSAVPGLTQESKRSLVGRKLTTLGQLSRSNAKELADNWALQTRAEVLIARARAQVSGVSERLANRHSYLMPPSCDIAIHLVADRDPSEGVLVALGCRIERPGQAPEEIVRTMPRAQESAGLVDVLSKVVAALAWADSQNANGQALVAHLFVYEPSEARDLGEALGRNLGQSGIRKGLLDLVRIFPPDVLDVPEPGYKSFHHIPATAVRSVLEQLYALPVPVSYDLASVTDSCAKEMETCYEPAEGFRHRFSSRLVYDQCERILAGEDPREVENDVLARLRTLSGIVAWLQKAHAAASIPFLRLAKLPFRFQRRFNPLSSEALDVLLAQELLHSHAARLQVLAELARPAPERMARLRCRGNLTYQRRESNSAFSRLTLALPRSEEDCEVGVGTFGTILTTDDPDMRLDPRRWPEVECIAEDETSETLTVRVQRAVFEGAAFQKILAELESGKKGYLDPIHKDVNTVRLERFLQSLSEA